MFCNCSSLSKIPELSEWNLYNLKSAERIFDGCTSLIIYPDISKYKIHFSKNKKIKQFSSISYSSINYKLTDNIVSSIALKSSLSNKENNNLSNVCSYDEIIQNDNDSSNEEYYDNFYL